MSVEKQQSGIYHLMRWGVQIFIILQVDGVMDYPWVDYLLVVQELYIYLTSLLKLEIIALFVWVKLIPELLLSRWCKFIYYLPNPHPLHLLYELRTDLLKPVPASIFSCFIDDMSLLVLLLFYALVVLIFNPGEEGKYPKYLLKGGKLKAILKRGGGNSTAPLLGNQ